MSESTLGMPENVKRYNFRKNHFVFDIEQAALLVIDMQEFFLNQDSHAHIPMAEQAIPRINKLIEYFRSNNSPVIFTQHIHKKGSFAGTMAKWWNDVMWEGNKFLDIDPRIDTGSEPAIIQKDRYDAFLRTNLEQLLLDSGSQHIVITGVMTNLCCETTARSAFCKDFEVYFLHDCTGTGSQELHEATLKNLAFGFAIITSSKNILEGSL